MDPAKLWKKCPDCQTDVAPRWYVCPKCGTRLRPAKEIARLVGFWFIWVPALIGFLALACGIVVINLQQLERIVVKRMFDGPAAIICLLLIIGSVIAAYWVARTFIKSLGSRVSLGTLGFPIDSWRAFRNTLLLVVVLPLLVGLSLFLLFFVICVGSLPTRFN